MRGGVALRALRLYALAVAGIASAFAVGLLIDVSGHRLVVNDSPSMPRGVYWIAIGAMPGRRGEVVWFRPEGRFAALIYGRGWLPDGMPLLKTVGGFAGDSYCVRDGRFVVAGVDVGPVFSLDSRGRPIPQIGGCGYVGESEFLPISTSLDRSFDGRYMGAVPMRNVLGVGRALVTF
jgi:conjugative transfer signal peptidase TraF